MITPSVSWFVSSEEDVAVVKELITLLRVNVQLAFYEKKDAEKWGWRFESCIDGVSSLHLPKGLRVEDYRKGGMVDELCALYEVSLMVVHPWGGELEGIVQVVKESNRILCFEVFGHKGQGSPFWLLSKFGEELKSDYLGLCVDFSHLEKDLCTFMFIKGLLPWVKMLHLSNRRGGEQHLPLFIKESDSNVWGVVCQLLALKGMSVKEMVLEYMPRYKDELVNQFYRLQSYLIRQEREGEG